MFNHKSECGDHKIFSYDITEHKFIQYFKELYNEENLNMLHLKSKDYHYLKDKLELGGLNEIDTDLHIKFYNNIKNNNTFKKIYCNFIKDIYKEFFPEEKYMIFQSYPSVRFQFMKSVAVPAHKDSDHLSNHPLGEKNFLIPITEMKNTNSIYIESEPDKKDFKSIHLQPGDLYYFNANTCTHYNEPNNEEKLRISLDFRIMLYDDYVKYLNTADLKKTNPRDLQRKREATLMLIGKYYQCFHKDVDINEMMNWYNMENIMQHRPTFEKEEAEATYKYMLEDSFVTEYKKTEEFVVDAMLEGALEWDNHTLTALFGEYSIDPTADWDGDSPDGRNELVFGDYPVENVIGVTVIWGYFSGPPKNRRIVEFDILFDTDFTWGDATLDSNVMDLQNIAVHELGHGIGMGDLYEPACDEQTMYGYSGEGDIEKRTLAAGDITGIQLLYGS